MAKKITIKDIAKELNIHHSTVSRALRGDKRVNKDTQDRVKEYARVHGYQINITALELRGERRNTIAIIVPNINHRLFSNVISYFTDIATQHDYVVSVFQTNENYELEKNIVDTIIQHNFAGVIASVSMSSKTSEHFEKLLLHKVPLVMFDRVFEQVNVPKVIVNNLGIMHEAVELLVDRGYRRIAHISGLPELNVFRERQRGYKMAIKKFDLDFEKILIVNHAFTINDGKTIAEEIINSSEDFDAIISDSSDIGLGLLRELRKNKRNNLAIITFGGSHLLEVVDPLVACIVQPEVEIAQKVYELLVEKIENSDSNTAETIVLSAKIERKNL
ncbi:LacI family DNA-binding transcriptional regulator [Sunxiuqinia sp. A32]|uniref:LacI family DNA-binding transcriptional regulator n=1 Tax=Sunxiuqinia sp. A32 TaxID=3461496 RepID=UPI0040460174